MFCPVSQFGSLVIRAFRTRGWRQALRRRRQKIETKWRMSYFRKPCPAALFLAPLSSPAIVRHLRQTWEGSERLQRATSQQDCHPHSLRSTGTRMSERALCPCITPLVYPRRMRSRGCDHRDWQALSLSLFPSLPLPLSLPPSVSLRSSSSVTCISSRHFF